MKIKLPIGLLAALMLAMAAPQVQAYGVYKPDKVVGGEGSDIVVNDGATVTVGQLNGDTAAADGTYAPIVKDGTSAITIAPNGTETLHSGFNVREGKVTVSGEGTLVITSEQGGLTTPTGGLSNQGQAAPWLVVAGKNAQMEINGATVTAVSPGSAQLTTGSVNVGNPDGNGSLLIQNGGQLNINGGSSSLFIGMGGNIGAEPTNVGGTNANATTESPTSDTRYVGEYHTHNGKQFGQGTVTVKGEDSKITAGQCIGVGHGTLNVEDKAVVEAKGNSWIGVNNDAEATVNVKNGATLDLRYLTIGQGSSGVVSTVNVTDATMKVATHLYSNDGATGNVTNITVSGQSSVEVGEWTSIGRSETSKDTLNIIGKQAKWSSGIFMARNQSVVNNEGGTLVASDQVWIRSRSVLVMSDNAVLDTAGAYFEAGQLTVTDVATFTGNVELDGDSVLTLGLGSTIYMTGGNLDFKASTLYVELGDTTMENALQQTLFTIYYGDEASVNLGNNTTVQFLQNGQAVENGTVALADAKVQLLPEPTTATLSLLALAAMATRRRRR